MPPKLENAKYISGEKFANYGHNAFYSAHVDDSTGEGILIIDLFDYQNGDFQRRFFFSEKIWFSIDEEKTESSRQLMGDWYWYFYDYRPITKIDAFTVKEFFVENEYIINAGCRYEGDSIKYAQRFCEEIAVARRERGYANTKKRTERELAELKKPPKGFYTWLDKTANAEWKYMFVEPATRRAAKTKIGYCGYCGEKVEVEKVKLGEKVKCPNCKSVCSTKSAAFYINTKTVICNKKTVSYLEPLADNRFCIREFSLIEDCFIDKNTDGLIYTKRDQRLYEFARWFCKFDGKGGLIFEKGYILSHDRRIGEWEKTKWCSESLSMVYPKGLNKLFRAAPGFNLWHIDFEKVAKKIHMIYPERLFTAPKEYNCFYNLFTNGFYNLTRETINHYYGQVSGIERKQGALKKALGLNKDEIKALATENIDHSELRMYQRYKIKSKKVVIKDFFDYLIISRRIKNAHLFFDGVIKRSTLYKFNQYFNKQVEAKQIGHIKEFANDYNDYLDMARKLKYDIKNQNVLFPKNFQKAHDELSKIISDMEKAKIEAEMKKRDKEIKRFFKSYQQLFGYENKDFVVSSPSCRADIINEGDKLHHCVASYANRVAKGQTIILFVRKKEEPDKPFYTLNIDPKDYHQIQCRGLQNCDTTKEVDRFLAEWRRKIIDPLKRSEVKCKKTA